MPACTLNDVLMKAAPFPTALAASLRKVLGAGRLHTEAAERTAYAYDNSRRRGEAGAVAFPQTEAEVAAIVRICHAAYWPVVVRGLGSNTVGATVPSEGALVISTERMNRIVAVHAADRYLIAEAGVSNTGIQAAAREQGLFWPPDPSSAAYSTLGGNLGCNAAGPHAVKYGTPRENILGLSAVTGTGEIIRVGTHTTKGVVGYDLTRLLLGSEGTLGIITRATLKLWPWPEAVITLRACYTNVSAAAAAVTRIMSRPDLPWVLEFMDRAALDLVRGQGVVLPEAAGALLLIEVEGAHGALDRAVGNVSRAAAGPGCLGVDAAANEREAGELRRARKSLSPALRCLREGKINEDVVVPVSQVPALVARLESLAAEAAIPIVSFGHVGNGNLHVNLLFDPDDPREREEAAVALPKVFQAVLDLGGTLSGEHGVGLTKRDFIAMELAPPVLDLMRGIKQVFDPHGILNRGKTLPLAEVNADA